VGCGKGALLERALQTRSPCIGFDYAPEYVALASRLVQGLRRQDVFVFCADAQAIPFADESFALVTMLDILEHVPDPQVALHEASRVLVKGGVFYANNPNRYNIFTPEDHVRIPLLGFVPRRWQKNAVRLIRNCDYRGVNLLSIREILGFLDRLTPGRIHVDGLRLDGHHSSRVKRFLQSHSRFLTTINHLFFRVLPSHNIIYRRN
jgi:SAM-dependent methyltransferase